MKQYGSDAALTLSATDSLQLIGVSISNLTAANFVFGTASGSSATPDSWTKALSAREGIAPQDLGNQLHSANDLATDWSAISPTPLNGSLPWVNQEVSVVGGKVGSYFEGFWGP